MNGAQFLNEIPAPSPVTVISTVTRIEASN